VIATVDRTEKLIGILKEQIDVENAVLREIADAEQQAEETAVKLVYLDVRLDTWKHIKFLEGLVEILNTTPCDKWSAKVDRYVDRVKLERTLTSIKTKEAEMAGLSEQALGMMKDPIGELLMTHLARDEQQHEEDLDKVIRLVQLMPLQSKKGKKGTDIKC
jgi:hypothetical protein